MSKERQEILALLQISWRYFCYEKWKCHVNLLNDFTALLYVNAQCKHKHIRPFLYVKVQKQIRLSLFSFVD